MSRHHDDFDFEPVRGLPQILPRGERMLWQGAPRWQDLAVHAFHARKVVWYFVALAAAQALFGFADGETLAQALRPFQWLVPMGLFTAAILDGDGRTQRPHHRLHHHQQAAGDAHRHGAAGDDQPALRPDRRRLAPAVRERLGRHSAEGHGEGARCLSAALAACPAISFRPSAAQPALHCQCR